MFPGGDSVWLQPGSNHQQGEPKYLNIYQQQGEPKYLNIYQQQGAPNYLNIYHQQGEPKYLNIYPQQGAPNYLNIYHQQGAPNYFNIYHQQGEPKYLNIYLQEVNSLSYSINNINLVFSVEIKPFWAQLPVKVSFFQALERGSRIYKVEFLTISP